MSEKQQILVRDERGRRKGVSFLPPSDFSASARYLLVAGLVLTIVGLGDVALFYWPPRFGDNEWEFGIIAQTVDALPLPTLGLVLLALSAVASGGRPVGSRVLAGVIGFGSLVLLALLGLFLLNIPVAIKALSDAQQAATQQGQQVNPLIQSGLKRGVAKVLVFGTAYVMAWSTLAIMLWRRGRTSRPAE